MQQPFTPPTGLHSTQHAVAHRVVVVVLWRVDQREVAQDVLCPWGQQPHLREERQKQEEGLLQHAHAEAIHGALVQRSLDLPGEEAHRQHVGLEAVITQKVHGMELQVCLLLVADEVGQPQILDDCLQRTVFVSESKG